jgi:probable HAF family extracellular repeat protein
MTALGTLGGTDSTASDINDRGQIAGWATSASGATHAFVTEPLWTQLYRIEDLGTLGGDFSEATALNQAGHVCGNARTASGLIHAFRWIDGLLADLDTFGGPQSNASAFTNTGRVVGAAQDSAGRWRPALWAPDYTRELRLLPGATAGTATDMNDFGVVAGRNDSPFFPALLGVLWTPDDLRANLEFAEITAVNARGHVVGAGPAPARLPMLWRGQEIVELKDDFPATDTAPTAVDLNACDQVVVTTTDGRTGRTRTWRWTDGRVQGIGDLGAGPTVGEAINDAGAIVGTSAGRAFLYTDVEGLVDLNERLQIPDEWVLAKAADINSAGQIVGSGFHKGRPRAFRLTPIPSCPGEPTETPTYPWTEP